MARPIDGTANFGKKPPAGNAIPPELAGLSPDMLSAINQQMPGWDKLSPQQKQQQLQLQQQILQSLADPNSQDAFTKQMQQVMADPKAQAEMQAAMAQMMQGGGMSLPSAMLQKLPSGLTSHLPAGLPTQLPAGVTNTLPGLLGREPGEKEVDPLTKANNTLIGVTAAYGGAMGLNLLVGDPTNGSPVVRLAQAVDDLPGVRAVNHQLARFYQPSATLHAGDLMLYRANQQQAAEFLFRNLVPDLQSGLKSIEQIPKEKLDEIFKLFEQGPTHYKAAATALTEAAAPAKTALTARHYANKTLNKAIERANRYSPLRQALYQDRTLLELVDANVLSDGLKKQLGELNRPIAQLSKADLKAAKTLIQNEFSTFAELRKKLVILFKQSDQSLGALEHYGAQLKLFEGAGKGKPLQAVGRAVTGFFTNLKDLFTGEAVNDFKNTSGEIGKNRGVGASFGPLIAGMLVVAMPLNEAAKAEKGDKTKTFIHHFTDQAFNWMGFGIGMRWFSILSKTFKDKVIAKRFPNFASRMWAQNITVLDREIPSLLNVGKGLGRLTRLNKLIPKMSLPVNKVTSFLANLPILSKSVKLGAMGSIGMFLGVAAFSQLLVGDTFGRIARTISDAIFGKPLSVKKKEEQARVEKQANKVKKAQAKALKMQQLAALKGLTPPGGMPGGIPGGNPSANPAGMQPTNLAANPFGLPQGLPQTQFPNTQFPNTQFPTMAVNQPPSPSTPTGLAVPGQPISKNGVTSGTALTGGEAGGVTSPNQILKETPGTVMMARETTGMGLPDPAMIAYNPNRVASDNMARAVGGSMNQFDVMTGL